jgi:hypothetical protein
VKDLANYSADELKALRQELQESFRARIQQNIKFGMKPSAINATPNAEKSR